MTTLAQQSPLRRFVTDGLRATIDSYTRGALPLHRFAWELTNRLGTLTEHTGLPHWRILITLRTAQRVIATIDTALRVTGRDEPTLAEQHTLTHAVTTLRTALPRLDPPDPVDPASRAHPPAVVLAVPTHRATGRRPTLIA
jgi:hypothetical protein